MQKLDQDPGYPSLDLVELDDLLHTARLMTRGLFLLNVWPQVFKAAVTDLFENYKLGMDLVIN